MIKEVPFQSVSTCQYKEVIFCHKWTIILREGVKKLQNLWVINTKQRRDRLKKWEGRMRRLKAKQFVHFRPQRCQLCDVRVKVWLTYEQWLSCPFCLAAPVSPHYTLHMCVRVPLPHNSLHSKHRLGGGGNVKHASMDICERTHTHIHTNKRRAVVKRSENEGRE